MVLCCFYEELGYHVVVNTTTHSLPFSAIKPDLTELCSERLLSESLKKQKNKSNLGDYNLSAEKRPDSVYTRIQIVGLDISEPLEVKSNAMSNKGLCSVSA